MRLNANTGGVARPARPASLTGRSGGVPNRPPQGIFWPSEYAELEPEPGPLWVETFPSLPLDPPWSFSGSQSPLGGARPDPEDGENPLFQAVRPFDGGDFRLDFQVEVPGAPLMEGEVFMIQVGALVDVTEGEGAGTLVAMATLTAVTDPSPGASTVALMAQYPGALEEDAPGALPLASGNYSLRLSGGTLSLGRAGQAPIEAAFPVEFPPGGQVMVVVQAVGVSGGVTRLELHGEPDPGL